MEIEELYRNWIGGEPDFVDEREALFDVMESIACEGFTVVIDPNFSYIGSDGNRHGAYKVTLHSSDDALCVASKSASLRDALAMAMSQVPSPEVVDDDNQV